ncbi:MAG: hypothetical protein RMK99_11585 [Anaerolineales bacterium]|nr:hypothetical protein [Anaerolineales bacterium]
MFAKESQRARLAFHLALAVGALLVLGLLVDAALLIGNVRLGQAALDEAARAAAQAVERVEADGMTTLELRLVDADGRPSAYTLAQAALDRAGAARVTLSEVFSDGGQIFVRGVVSSPVFLLRLVGLNELTLTLVADAEPDGETLTRP